MRNLNSVRLVPPICPIQKGVLFSSYDFSVELVTEGTMWRGSQILILASFSLLSNYITILNFRQNAQNAIASLAALDVISLFS